MLDQNTDRMWFVIGAVIVGAAIIFVANGTLPTLFASVSDSFEESASKGTTVIENVVPNIGDNLINQSSIRKGEYVTTNGTMITEANPVWLQSDGFDWAVSGNLPVRPNTSYTYRVGNVVRNLRVAYYRHDGTFIDYTRNDYEAELVTVSPHDASYAIVSAPFQNHSLGWAAVDTWWFGETGTR